MDALSEYVGNQWRADVYAKRGRYRLAFEIQWSKQTLQVQGSVTQPMD